MATAAEPLPAELPLPGGRPGTTVRVHPLLTATMTAAACRDAPRRGTAGGLEGDRASRSRRPTGCGSRSRPSWSSTPAPGLILVDTGFHPSVVVDPNQAFGRLAGLLFKDLEMTAEQAVPGPDARPAASTPTTCARWS